MVARAPGGCADGHICGQRCAESSRLHPGENPMSAALPFPMSLAEKYRPRAIAEFVGLDKPKRILAKFAASPYASAWLYVGPPGCGKTTMALALAETLRAELHHIPSQQCCIGKVEDVIRQC